MLKVDSVFPGKSLTDTPVFISIPVFGIVPLSPEEFKA